ncbi:serine/threonine protein phosphatase [Thecamonas trahens ATCC 50062]|uniref:Serine/threonine protein phosphatase n=1 Tax=Thecamonas trahens ATCC 50062 TaxID=461836 RepID=A0A0L0DB79_THETB|nr:serine/threonine protein phosphatase [Thecamonas trahens ATCC 50062]KNC49366.1 serine/threonine protein phosphatase [Thecamonas trahens ATCC 50062]|eukprot:XP_013757791.1 serine/threonine protein phosphatase [Thecamonas trahens ATCC 50062]
MSCCKSVPVHDDELEMSMSEISATEDNDVSGYKRITEAGELVRFAFGEMIGAAQDVNSQFRTEMQDVIVIDDAFGPDGLPSEIAAEFLPRVLAQEVGQRDPKDIFQDAFLASDTVFENEGILYHGTTAMCVMLEKYGSTMLLHLGSVGDSRAVLSSRGRAIDLAPVHTPASEDEVTRIQREGGFLARGKVNGMVAVTRSLGDLVMKSIIISDPFTRTEVLTADNDCIVIACDGVWDVIHPQSAIDTCIRSPDAKSAAQAILKAALELGSTDNLSVICVKLT